VPPHPILAAVMPRTMTLRRAGADVEADYDATAAAAAAAAAAAGEQHHDRLEMSGVPPIALVVEESHIKVFRCCCCLRQI
jgi:hypothetical protein